MAQWIYSSARESEAGASLLPPEAADFVASIPVVVIGGGACGLTAALAAREAGAEVVVIERDRSALGTTAMSTGLIPGAGSRFQHEADIDDGAALFTRDILEKTHGRTDADMAAYIAEQSGPVVEWLADRHAVPLSLVDTFRYPGHSRMRMHGTPNRTGAELMGALHAAAERAGVDILLEAPVSHLFAEPGGRVRGVRITRADGQTEDIACDALVLACCGFGGAPDMVAELIPEIAGATFFGHPGNKGDALRWGMALGAAAADIQSYQGHAGLIDGQGIPLLWAHIIEGGIQVNLDGLRFANETRGYSEQAIDVVAQPGHVAWSIYDARRHELMLEFEDYRDAIRADCLRTAGSVSELAAITGLPEAALAETLAGVEAMVAGAQRDPLGRDFAGKPPLAAPYYAVKVTGALFHTQGGLVVDREARVLRQDAAPLPNLFAGGGAARGVSGPSCWGYLAGNGLVTATVLGRAAGTAAARQVLAATAA